MKVAILGGSGFIGSRLVERLHLEDKSVVRAVVRSNASAACLGRFDLDIRIADALDLAALRLAFADCDAVIHTAGGDAHLLCGSVEPVYKAAQFCGVKRLVYLSSACVHGQAPPVGTTEDSPMQLRQPLVYNNARVIAERQLAKLRRFGSVETVVLRPSVVYGPRSLNWIAGAAQSLINGNAYLIDNGRGICNSVYVDNLIDAIYLSLTAPSANCDEQAFFIGDEERVTWRDFYSQLALPLAVDLSTIATVPMPIFTTTWTERALALRSSALVQAILPQLPARFKYAVKAFLVALTQPQTDCASTVQAAAIQAGPTVTKELALLQSCQYKLPFAKAAQRIGYQPGTSFAEGMRRSISWLEFAGYPVMPSGANQKLD